MNNLGELEDNRCEIIYILDEKKKTDKDLTFFFGFTALHFAFETGLSYMSSSLIPNGM